MISSNDSAWSQLECDYFKGRCLEVVGEYFQILGFSWRETSVGGVLFYRDNVFVELSYVPETCPAYAPAIVVGLGENQFSEDGSPNGVPLWYLISDASPGRGYSNWRFSSEVELIGVLARIRAETLDIHVIPLLSDTARLASWAEEFSRGAPKK